MLGGRILGEGVDGCIFTEPMWPCSSDSADSTVNSKNSKYVSKLVSIKDTESENLKMAARILGPELTNNYTSAMRGQCKPADLLHNPRSKNIDSFKAVRTNMKITKKRSGVCKSLGVELESGKPPDNKYKIMYISRYSMDVDTWVGKLQQPLALTVQSLENAIPKFLEVLQTLYQGTKEQLIHIDLHTGNIFIKENPLEFGIADFGHCISRRYDIDQSVSFYGEFLNNFIAKYDIYSGQYTQTPFESRILNYCFRKSMENVNPAVLVQNWNSDPEGVAITSGSTDILLINRAAILSYLIKKPLFIAMIQVIQSISKKLKTNVMDNTKTVESLTSSEKTVIDYILTRYSVISPLITINNAVMGIYRAPLFNQDGSGTTRLTRFIKKAILAPYENNTVPLVNSLNYIKDADLRILWNMTQ